MNMTREPGGGEREFESFFADHISPVRHYARTLVPASDVDDVVQLTFTTAWQRFDAIPAGSHRSWLYGTARNHARNRRRTTARRQSLVEALKQNRPAVTNRLADSGFTTGDAEALIAVIDELNDDDHELMVLSGWFEMTPAEIARILGVEPGTVRVRLHRLRKLVNERFAANTEEGGGLT